MTMAIEEGKKGYGFVAPNPAVGCVILDRDQTLISKGYHRAFGDPHAEIEALKGLNSDLLEGAHMYVTLEPCSHFGKTPPCTDRLVQIPFASVTYGVLDPNPLVNGKGLEKLRDAGILVRSIAEAAQSFLSYNREQRGRRDPKLESSVQQTLLRVQEDLETLIEDFKHNLLSKKPFVALKVASSLDGQMALKTGESQWITNALSREHAHYLRGIFSAVAVGRRTILIDDPRLNVRHPAFPNKPNKVVIFDPQGEVLEGLERRAVYGAHDPQDIFVVIKKGLKGNQTNLPTAQIIEADTLESGAFELDPLLRALYERGVYSLLLEGGAYLYETFLKQKKVHRIYQFQAPIILGAGEGLPWTQGFGISTMAEKVRVRSVRTQFFEDDILVTGRID